MQVLLNTDHHVTASGDLTARVEADVRAALDRFEDRITRAEVHLNDEASGKAGADDKRCMIEVRPRGHSPMAVTATAESIELAVAEASSKIERALDSLFGRLSDRRADASTGGEA